MFAKVRYRKVAASMLLLALVIILALGYFLRRQNFENSMAKVMYLVPKDETKIEELVKPETLASQTDIWIETTSDWEQISQLAAHGKLYAVIIHHAAVSQVNLEELQHLYNHKRLVVVGIGISTHKMEEMIDAPIFNLFRNIDGPNDDICNNAICSVIYSTPDDYKEETLSSGKLPRRTTDLLNNDDSIHRMWNSIKLSIWEMQSDYQSSDKARPTLTFTEVEELLRDPNHQ